MKQIDGDRLIEWLEIELKKIKESVISTRRLVNNMFPDELKEDSNHTIDLAYDVAIGITEETIKKIKSGEFDVTNK